MENDERHAPGIQPVEVAPPPELMDPTDAQPTLLQGGRTPIWRHRLGILRAAPRPVLEAQQRGVRSLQHTFPDLAGDAPASLSPIIEHQGVAWLLEEDLGTADPEPLERLEAWNQRFVEARAERCLHKGTTRELLRLLEPHGLPRSSHLVRALRQARTDGAALPFPPRQATLERALDQELELELTRTWTHGALRPGRLLRRGACHWSRFGRDGWLGQDHAPFVEPDAEDPAGALAALAWGWRHDAERAAEALVALGVVQPAPPAWVELRVDAPHPCLGPRALERLLGVAPGRVPAGLAARALGRGDGLVVAGTPLRISTDPAVRPRRSAAPWRVRDRDPCRLFSRWHEGIRLDPDARASLTPEAQALATAKRLRAEVVVDAFCGAGGNAIAFARMPWCEQVIAVDLDPERVAMARHNAGLYGVQDRVRFVQGDFFALAPELADEAQACFLDPPWAAGEAMAARAWTTATDLFSRGAMKQPRQAAPPPGAQELEAVFGVGPIISWVLAWWDR